MPMERGSLLLNRYRILEVLGQGGMGSVYKARDENLAVDVAVKENLFTTDEYTRQFRREATILANLKHSNLPRVFDHFEVAGQGQYLVMDYIEGEDLRQRMDRIGIISEEEIIVTGAAICDALEYLHTRQPPIVHRDIKPGNVKINPNGEIFLVDFGLAKVFQGTQATTTGARAMTPGYSSPEQYGTARTDERSDIYSLGATLYAAMTGSIPEDGLARAMEQADLTPIRKRNPKVSRRLATVLEQALAVHPEDRFPTADKFKQGLLGASLSSRRKAGAGELTVTPPPDEVVAAIGKGKTPVSKPIARPKIDMSGESKSRVRRRKQQRRLRIAMGISGVFVAGVLGLYWSGLLQENVLLLLLGASPTSTRTQAADSTETTLTAEPTNGDATATEEVTPTATRIVLGGSGLLGGGPGQIAFASAPYGTDGQATLPQIWLMDVALDDSGVIVSSNLTQLTTVVGGACHPEWSPDGSRMVFISPCEEQRPFYINSNLYLMNADGSDIAALPTPVGSFDPAWSPDGTTLLFANASDVIRSRIMSYDFASGEVSTLVDSGTQVLHPVWSPDGDQIMMLLTPSFQLFVMENAPGSPPRQFTRSANQLNSFPAWSPTGNLVIFSQKPVNEPATLDVLISQVFDPELLGTAARSENRLVRSLLPAREADFSPDGVWIAFEGWPNVDHSIYIMRADGTLLSGPLTSDLSADFDPDWRPEAD